MVASPLNPGLAIDFSKINMAEADVQMEDSDQMRGQKKKRRVADATDPIEIGKCAVSVLRDQMGKRMLTRVKPYPILKVVTLPNGIG